MTDDSLLQRVRVAVSAALSRVGFLPVPSAPSGTLYHAPPIDEVLFMTAVSVEESSGDLAISHVVEPLFSPSPLTISGGSQRYHLDPSLGNGDAEAEIAKAAWRDLRVLRGRYDGARQFAASIDDEYLADDWPELAASVAYMWLAAGELDRAYDRLRSLADRIDGIDAPTREWASQASAVVLADSEAARRMLDEWRRARLEAYGLIEQSDRPA